MSSARSILPSVYAHASQPQWGRAVVVEAQADRTRYIFENAGERTFMNGHAAIREVKVAEDEREALAKGLLKKAAPPASAKKKAARAAKPPAPKANTLTFDRQLALFLTTFPRGFADARFSHEERGGATDGPQRRTDAAIALAADRLSKKELDAAIAKKAFGEVFARAVEVISAVDHLSMPKTDKPSFTRIPESAHERLAKALRDLLWGDGAYGGRFDAFVAALGADLGAGKSVAWTIATLFSALVHPSAHVFVKPTISQRQASVVGLAEPATAAPSAAGYAAHLAIATALREKLVAAGQTPRDLFDVYTFSWRTLSKAAQTGRTAAAAAAPPA